MIAPVVLVGWAGTALYLAAHAYVGFSDHARVPGYYLTNLVAAVLTVAVSLHYGTGAAVALHAVWGAISLAALSGLTRPAFAPRPQWLIAALVLLSGSAIVLFPISGLRAAATMLGWAGAVVFVGTYLLFAAGRCERRAYLGFMAYASLAMLPVLVLDRNWPVLALEATWAAISIAALTLSGTRRESS